MQIVTIIQLVLALLQGTATALNKSGLAQEAEGVQAAILSLQKVSGTLTTKEQVEGFKIQPLW